jgi:hypothetical protein
MDKYKAEKKASQEKAKKLQQEKSDALEAAMTPEERAQTNKRAKRNKLILLAIAASFVSLVVIGMLGDSGTSETSSNTSSAVTDNSGVNWSDYAPTVKTRIEEFIQSADCSSLQKEFDVADQNDAAQRNRVGVGNADLMNYINTSMEKLGCS